MKASEEAYRLIRLSEGLRLTTYRCSAGVLTIGYGHTGPDVRPGMTITEQRADELLSEDVAKAERAVNSRKWQLTQGQFDALVDFVFNLGEYKVANSTLFGYLHKDMPGLAVEEFRRWVYGKDPKTGCKVKMPGLITRRERDRQLFETGVFA